jgi:hypothetical protein
MKQRDLLKHLLSTAVSAPLSQSAFAAMHRHLPSYKTLGCNADMLTIKRSVEALLLSVPTVTGVGIGFRQENGVIYDEDSIRVYSRDRRIVSQLLPREIDGVPVSVVDGDFRPAAGPPLPDDDTRYPTLKGGMRITNPSTSTLLPEGFGTLGAIVQDVKTGDPRGLTCFHVVGLPQAFPFVVWQPNDPGFPIGVPISRDNCVGAVTMVDWPKTQTPEIIPQFVGFTDSAVFSIEDAIKQGRKFSRAILDHAGTGELVPSISGTMSAFKGQPVRKRGFRTRVRHGFVVDPDVTAEWTPQTQLPVPQIPKAFLFNQALIQGTDVGEDMSVLPFAKKGDSGSVVLDGTTNKAVGLLWAVDHGQILMSPIQEVESRLGIRMVW